MLRTSLILASRKSEQVPQPDEYTIYTDIPILQASQLKRVDDTYCLASPRRIYFIYIDLCPPSTTTSTFGKPKTVDSNTAAPPAPDRLVNPIPIWLYCFYEFLSRYDLEHLGALYTGETHHPFLYAVLNDLRRKAKEADEFYKLGPMSLDAIALGSKPLVFAMMLHLANARKRALKVYDESWASPLYPTPKQLETGAHMKIVPLADQDVLQPETLWEVSLWTPRSHLVAPSLADSRYRCQMFSSGTLITRLSRRSARVSHTGSASSCSCNPALST